MRINQHGNVGIGTSNATSRLTVNGMIESISGGFKLSDGTVIEKFADLSMVQTSDTPPSNPLNGTMWWDDVGGRLYVYYDSYWVDTGTSGGASTSLANGPYLASLDSTGTLTIPGLLKAPQSTKYSGDPGIPGEICWDSFYIYVYTGSGWKRTQLSSF
jgi:hypothetical protein